MEVKEFKFEVPWGYLTGKTHGTAGNRPMITLHGLHDTCASFDSLIPLLPSDYFYIVPDLPGHGRSSNFHPFLPYQTLDNVLMVKYLMKHFQIEKTSFLSHSYGGHVSMYFALIYPEKVERLILLDSRLWITTEPSEFLEKSKLFVESSFAAYEDSLNNKNFKIYTYEEAVDRIQNNRYTGPLTREAAELLAKRKLEKLPDGKYRMKPKKGVGWAVHPQHDFRYLDAVLKNNSLECPILFITSSLYWEWMMLKQYAIGLFSYNNFKNVQNKFVDGTHDVHLNRPEIVAPHINSFLKSYNKL